MGRTIRAALNSTLGLAVLFASVGCEESPSGPRGRASPGAPADVVATCYPLAYFATRIAPQLAIDCPVGAARSPSDWRPSPDAIHDMQGASLIIANGAGYEHWLGQANLPRRHLVETAGAFEAEWLPRSTATHSHGNQESTLRPEPIGATWWDPVFARQQARATFEALSRLRPNRREEYERARGALDDDLQAIDTRLRELTPRWRSTQFIALEEGFAYLARRYELDATIVDASKQETAESKIGAALSALTAKGAIIVCIAGRETWMQDSAAIASLSAPANVRVAQLLALDREDSEHDWIACWQQNINRLHARLAD